MVISHRELQDIAECVAATNVCRRFHINKAAESTLMPAAAVIH